MLQETKHVESWEDIAEVALARLQPKLEVLEEQEQELMPVEATMRHTWSRSFKVCETRRLQEGQFKRKDETKYCSRQWKRVEKRGKEC